MGRRTKGSGISTNGLPDNQPGGPDPTVPAKSDQDHDVRNLLDSLTSPAANIDLEHKFKYANPAYAEWFGFDRDEIIGKHIRDVIGESGYNDILPEVDRVLAGEPVSYERIVSYSDGTDRFVRVTYAPEIGDGGVVRGCFSMIVDATEQYETEQALKASEERYRAFISQSSEGIWRIELDEPIATSLPVDQQVRSAYEHGYLAECNDAMARQYGFRSADEIVGTRLRDLLVESDPNNTEFLKAFIASGYRLNDAESHELDAQGNDRYFLNNFVGFTENGFLLRAWGSQRDITQTKFEELAKSRLASIVESSDDAIIGLDLNGVVTSWNQAAEKVYGYSTAEIVGRPMADLIPEDRSANERAVFSRVISGEKVDHYETTRQSKDGRLIDVSLTISPIRDKAGNVIGVSKIARDISDRKETERVISENRIMLSMAMQSSSMGVWENDLATGLIAWSEELESIFGLKRGEFRGTEEHYYQLIHEDDRDAAWHEVQLAVAERRPYTIEFRFYHSDGSVRWMEGRGEAVYSQSGAPIRLYCIGIDITDRKRAEEKIREGEERFRMALSSGAVTVYEQDLDLRYEWLYPASLYPSDVVGKNDQELAPGKAGQVLTEVKQRVLKSGEPIREEVSVEVLGVNHWYDLSIEPRFNEKGKIIGVGGTALDITVRKNAETELKRQALLLEAALEPVIVWEFGGKIIDWNRGAERLYGYAANEAIGRVCHDLLKTKYSKPFHEIEEGLKRNGNWFGELRHTTKSGDEIVVESRHQLIEFDGRDLILEANRDVTEKRRVSDELKRSEARLQAMFDSTTVGIAVLDRDSRFLQINDAFCRVTGFTRNELLMITCDALTHPDDISIMVSGLGRLVRGEIPYFTFENRYIRKDGTLVWVQNSFSLTRDDKNEPLHLIAITQDITARKEAERDLELLSRMPSENPHPVLRISPEGDLLYGNPAAKSLLDSWKANGETVASDILSIVRDSYETLTRRDIEFEYEGHILHCTIAPISEAGYVNLYGTDITAAKRALIALQESEQRFSRFMQQFPGLAWIKDADGRYVYANDSAEKAFAAKKDELYGRSDDEIFPSELAAMFKEHDRQAIESGSGRQFLETLLQDDGIVHYSIVSKFPIVATPGDNALIGGMAIDVTDQKQAEEALRRRVEFDEAVVTNMGEGLLTTDAEGLVTSMNPAAERLFGWTFEELRGRRLHDAAHYKYRDGSPYLVENCSVLSAVSTGKALLNHEDVFIHKDGHFFDVLFSSSPLNENGVTTGLVVVFQDISERKRSEEQLERYRHLSEYASDIIWLLKDDGTIVEVNRSAVDAYGYSHDEMIGMNVSQLRHPADISNLNDQIDAARNGNVYFETIHMRKDGSSFPVEVNASSAEFGGERLIMSILRDITERKRQQRDHDFLLRLAELIRTETDPSKLMNGASEMLGEHLELGRCFISLVDLDAKTSTVISEYRTPDAAELEQTISFDDYSDSNLQAAIAGETIVVSNTATDQRTADKYDTSYGLEGIVSYVAVPQARDGRMSEIFFASRPEAYEWRESEVALVQTVSERVWLAAEKLRSDAAFRESERRAMEEYQRLLERIVPLAETLGAARDLLTVYRSLQQFICASMDCSGFFVAFYDIDKKVRLPAFAWGEGEELDIESLPPMPVHEQGGPNSRAILGKRTVITNNYWEDQRTRPHVVLQENGIDPMSSLVVPMVVQDRVTGTLEVQSHRNGAFDREHAIALEMAANLSAVAIENVRLIETEARARAEAETANRMKDEFLSVLSHELRTPLNAMLGWVRILRGGNVDADRLSKALEIIERNTRQQSSLIEDLLDVSRIISGKMRIETELIDLVPSLEQAAESVRPIAAAKDIYFNVEIAREPLYLKGDAVRLQQVITNLLQNAIKFTGTGGEVSLSWTREGPDVVIKVSDTGIGIEKDFLPIIFDRFSQADASTRRNNTGLGLGLTIVRTIVELHGGTTAAHSDGPSTGASFSVKLPLAEEFYKQLLPQSEPVTNNSGSDSLSGVRILLVDDDQDGLLPLRILLENEKALVTCVLSAGEALDELEARDFDILISDIGMPSMDGFELISKLRSDRGGRNYAVKAIAYTAYASEDDKNRILSSGYEVHLTKPLDMDELLRIVHKFSLAKHHYNNGN